MYENFELYLTYNIEFVTNIVDIEANSFSL